MIALCAESTGRARGGEGRSGHGIDAERYLVSCLGGVSRQEKEKEKEKHKYDGDRAWLINGCL